MIAERTTVMLQGEQAALFATIKREEDEAIKAIRAKRANIIAAILAAQSLLSEAEQTPGCEFEITDTAIIITPPARTVERTLSLETA